MAVLLTALVGYLLMHRLQTNSVQSVQQSIDGLADDVDSNTLGSGSPSLPLAGNIWLPGWADATILSRAKATRLTGVHWRAVTWLVLLELVLGQGVLVNAIGLMVRA